jgi:hypothetical protein
MRGTVFKLCLAAGIGLAMASAMLAPAPAHAASKKPKGITRSQEAKMWCAYWKPIDPKRYKECLARNR